jgi:hypothetical protein
MTDENQSGQAPIENEPIAQAPAEWPASPATYPAGAQPPAYPTTYPPAPIQAGPRTSSNAIISLVLAVASWAVCPIVAAIVSLVFASMASKEIDAAGGQVEGRSLVTAARIVAWINIGVTVAAFVIAAFVLVLIAIAGGFDSANNR